ncbi:hypothetical protein BFP72_00695 [Reichenbachiella sp. 5M10]|nr:hypothetical protein BFP72_00695 [Reichenbachiella sp. 5M10]
MSVMTFMTLGQAPAWMDPATRMSQWPDDQYLSVMVSETVGKKDNQTQIQTQMYQLVKSQLSDAILVSINAETHLNISVKNAETDQLWEQRSRSASDVELVGLKQESYYDKRQKSLFVFGYVSIEELSNYHRAIIQKNINEIMEGQEQVVRVQSKSQRIEWLSQTQSALSAIEKSVQVLTALSQPHGADLSFLRQVARDSQKELNDLFHSGRVSLEDIKTRLATELLMKLPNGTVEPARLESMYYSQTTVGSEFSSSLFAQLGEVLGDDPRITLSTTGKARIVGVYSMTEEEVMFQAAVINGREAVLSSSSFSVGTSVIDRQGLKLLPTHFEFISKLPEMVVEAPAEFHVKPNEFVSRPIMVRCVLGGRSVSNMPFRVRLDHNGKSKYYGVLSSDDGVAAFYLTTDMVSPGADYRLDFSLDLARYLSVSEDTPLLSAIRNQDGLSEGHTELTVLSPTIFVRSSEEGIEEPLRIKVIEPALKSGLAQLRYAFVEERVSSDYELVVEAFARKGQTGDIATLAYVDATVSLIDLDTQKEIYKNSFYDIKGIGANFDDAQAKAFQKAKSQIVDDLTYELEYNR